MWTTLDPWAKVLWSFLKTKGETTISATTGQLTQWVHDLELAPEFMKTRQEWKNMTQSHAPKLFVIWEKMIYDLSTCFVVVHSHSG